MSSNNNPTETLNTSHFNSAIDRLMGQLSSMKDDIKQTSDRTTSIHNLVVSQGDAIKGCLAKISELTSENILPKSRL